MTIQEVDIAEMRKLVQDGARLVDVREEDELREGMIEGSSHLALSRIHELSDQISRNQPTVFYCRSGRRSLKAAELAQQWTSQPLYSLRGGILDFWANAQES